MQSDLAALPHAACGGGNHLSLNVHNVGSDNAIYLVVDDRAVTP